MSRYRRTRPPGGGWGTGRGRTEAGGASRRGSRQHPPVTEGGVGAGAREEASSVDGGGVGRGGGAAPEVGRGSLPGQSSSGPKGQPPQ